MITTVLEGRISKAPVMATANIGGQAATVARFSMACPSDFSDKTLFVNVTVAGKTADKMQNLLHVGNWVGVTGELSLSAYLDKEGKAQPSASMMVNRVRLLGNAMNTTGAAVTAAPAAGKANYDAQPAMEEVTLPF